MVAALQRLSAPPVQTLHTLQPTPATVSYTVSTRPEATTLTAKLRFYAGIALRILPAVALAWTLGDARAEEILVLVSRLPWRYLAPASLCAVYLALRRGYAEESLLVLRGLGLQTSTASSIYLRTPTTRFIPTTSVQDIFIHEAFKGFEIRFYLAVVVKGEEDVVVVFPRLLPRRGILEEVWRGSRRCLWEDAGGAKKKGEEKGRESA
ncbi:uncharacterized protein CC84DRAFT_1133758 [Paraphaeosphaeria sporulosa]|uniref:Phosphatidylinositol N-acetylglucosaminyltransferase subunit H conserved domain-containing protein n=1 Tax=Paraphaeosphaeria sporulosa TaxID=1460663 RepID=A0A177CX09_9PLEO|nr:uncharacterized protein CC84DRAFT_1133758 [Paraphaeosphaeria sporulosa]OAG11746.1 hypothetical protein CC84DRAFT_1133758 [Paraphaeosphaeria sporulosa]